MVKYSGSPFNSLYEILGVFQVMPQPGERIPFNSLYEILEDLIARAIVKVIDFQFSL